MGVDRIFARVDKAEIRSMPIHGRAMLTAFPRRLECRFTRNPPRVFFVDAATLLDQHFAVPGSDYPNVFLVGCRSRRVTVYDQQIRAINLIAALVEAKRIEKKDKVAIVGGGIAGLTAAVAAGRVGAYVDVFEESVGEESAIRLQRSSGQRLLHPRIYDWPMQGFQNGKTDFHCI